VRGYNALEIGLTIIVTGLVTMAMSPLSTAIARLLDLRAMLAIGFGLFAFSMYLTATLTNQTGFWELFVPLAVRGLGADLLLPAGQYDRDGHVAAGDAKKRGRSLQSDPRSRRCDRPGRDRHADERAGAFPLEPIDREH